MLNSRQHNWTNDTFPFRLPSQKQTTICLHTVFIICWCHNPIMRNGLSSTSMFSRLVNGWVKRARSLFLRVFLILNLHCANIFYWNLFVLIRCDKIWVYGTIGAVIEKVLVTDLSHVWNNSMQLMDRPSALLFSLTAVLNCSSKRVRSYKAL